MTDLLKNKWLGLRINAKVGLILIILVFACLTVAGSAFLQSTRTTEKLHIVVNTLLPATQLSQHALTTFTEELKLYEDAILTDEELLLQKGYEKEHEVERLLKRLSVITDHLQEKDFTAVAVLNADIARYAEQAIQVYGQMIQSIDGTESEQMYNQAIRLGQQAPSLQERLSILNTSLQDLLEQHLEDVRLFTLQQQRLGVMLSILTIFFALLISFLLTRLITRPIIALATVARQITKGSRTSELLPVGNDEVAELTRSLADMLASLHQREEALVQSEKKYREIFNATKEAIVIYDATTMQMRDANQTCCEITGYPHDEILTMQFGAMSAGFPPYTQKEAHHFFTKTLAGTPQIFEWLVKKKNGDLGWAEISLTLSEIDKDRVLILVARDISERKRDEAEREELAKQLQHAEKMETLGTLAGGIAHDFNNILAGILGYTELAALRPDAGEKSKADLEKVKQAALRAKDLVSQILAFSRKSEKEVIVFEPTTIVKEVVNLLRSSVPANIAIQQQIATKSRIEADPSQFHQIIMNLCTNAVHAMEETGGALSVTLSDISTEEEPANLPKELASGRYLSLEIKDTGTGMDEATMGRIFEPYFTTKGVGKGTGLGLSVVHGIIKECGGQITVSSIPGKGTSFRLYLPTIEAELTTETSANPFTERPSAEGSGKMILLVDDEQSLTALLADFFSMAGYRVKTCSSGTQALECFLKAPAEYDMLVTDMTMPGISGLELSRQILARRPEMPIIMLTGFSEQVNREKALATGIKEFYLKPPDTQQLLLTVRTLLTK